MRAEPSKTKKYNYLNNYFYYKNNEHKHSRIITYST